MAGGGARQNQCAPPHTTLLKALAIRGRGVKKRRRLLGMLYPFYRMGGTSGKPLTRTGSWPSWPDRARRIAWWGKGFVEIRQRWRDGGPLSQPTDIPVQMREWAIFLRLRRFLGESEATQGDESEIKSMLRRRNNEVHHPGAPHWGEVGVSRPT